MKVYIIFPENIKENHYQAKHLILALMFLCDFFFMFLHTPAKPIVQLHPIPPHHGDDLQPLSRPGPLHFLLLFTSPGNFLFMSGPVSCSPNGPYQGTIGHCLTCIVMNGC